jgi:hypothetical protein
MLAPGSDGWIGYLSIYSKERAFKLLHAAQPRQDQSVFHPWLKLDFEFGSGFAALSLCGQCIFFGTLNLLVAPCH